MVRLKRADLLTSFNSNQLLPETSPHFAKSTPWDVAIIGQGLAGSCIAWQLHFRGWRPLLIDAGEEVTASKIAAGLITPITGKRMVVSWQAEAFFPEAQAFYHRVEQLTGQRFFHPRIALRVLQDARQSAEWRKRAAQAPFQPWLAHNVTWPNAQSPEHGFFAMQTARLDVPAFLAATRAFFEKREQYRQERLDVSYLPLRENLVHLPLSEPTQAKQVVFCQGFTKTPAPQFSWVPFKAARGDILTLHCPNHGLAGFDFHGGGWVAPLDADTLRMGSTYDWAHLENIPSPSAPDTLMNMAEKLLGKLLSGSPILAHYAAVRPIVRESKGVLGRHPAQPQYLYFNGLGSKGSMHGPRLAAYLADHLCTGAALPAEHDLAEN
jgi:glycine oxidase